MEGGRERGSKGERERRERGGGGEGERARGREGGREREKESRREGGEREVRVLTCNCPIRSVSAFSLSSIVSCNCISRSACLSCRTHKTQASCRHQHVLTPPYLECPVLLH